MRDLVGRNTRACVGDGNDNHGAFGRGIDDDLTSGRGKLHRVVKDIGEDQVGEPLRASDG